MIPTYLLIASIGLDVLLCIGWTWMVYSHHKLKGAFAWQLDAAERANANYRKNRQTILERNDQLQRQLEIAEAKWGEAISQNKWHEREMDLFLQKYKDLEEQKDRLQEQYVYSEKKADVTAQRVLELQKELHEIGEKHHQLQQAYNLINHQSDPHAFPM